MDRFYRSYGSTSTRPGGPGGRGGPIPIPVHEDGVVHNDGHGAPSDPDAWPCPECGARSAKPGYHGHGMHCRRFYVEETSGA